MAREEGKKKRESTNFGLFLGYRFKDSLMKSFHQLDILKKRSTFLRKNAKTLISQGK